MEFRDYYKILGVERSATADQIKTAYRRLARKYHPDVSKEPNAEARFKEMQEAYEVLRDPEKRAAYDQLGSDWKSGQSFRPPPDWGSGFEFSGRPGGAGGRRHSAGRTAVAAQLVRRISATSFLRCSVGAHPLQVPAELADVTTTPASTSPSRKRTAAPRGCWSSSVPR
jgi:curved DNA-binding protein